MGFFNRIFGRGGRQGAAAPAAPSVPIPPGEYAPADVYAGLRGQLLALKPHELGLSGDEPFAALMETGYPEAVATLVVAADGTTSLYFSNGGGMIGAGAHEAVRTASSAFLADLAAVSELLDPTTAFPLPKRRHVRFYLVSGEGVRTAEALEDDLGHNRHALSPVFHSAHAVITAVRESSP